MELKFVVAQCSLLSWVSLPNKVKSLLTNEYGNIALID